MLQALIVEDNDVFGKFIKETLVSKTSGILYSQARTCSEARERFEEFSPRLVLMDLRLPDGSGLQLIKEFKQRCPEAVVIVLTSYDLPEYRSAALDNGATHFLVKGAVTGEELSSLVNSVAFQIV